MEDLNKEIEQALDLLDRIYKQSSNQKKLILDKAKTVYLQIVLFKIPFTAPRRRKFLRLRHSLHGNDPEICLFVPNRKTGVDYKKTTDELIDFCVDHYTGILEKHKVKGITTVMPLKQLKSEYGSYELRRKLVQRFDLFLCKNSLLYNSRFLTSLGKSFRLANKEPLGVSFPKEDDDYDPEFQKNIDRAIFTSSFYINPFSDNYSVPFGCLSNTRAELKENLQLVLQQIFNKDIIPGGFKNVRAMYLWPSQSKPVPLYICPELPVDLKNPHIKSKGRKRVSGVEGELSTQPQKKVFVTSSGEVFITKVKEDLGGPKVQDSESDESFKDESDDDGGDDDGDDDDDDDKKENLKSVKAVGSEEESESEDDEEIEEKEARLLEMKRRTESESDLKAKTNQKIKRTQNGAKDLNNENGKASKGSKLEKTQLKKGKMNKSQRKTLIKQKKYNLNERVKVKAKKNSKE